MGEKSSKRASTPTGAVFLSYASQDAEAAQKICGALRAAGIEVWFAPRGICPTARCRFVRRRRRFRADCPREFFAGGALKCRTPCRDQ
jgi:hypothetical protein